MSIEHPPADATMEDIAEFYYDTALGQALRQRWSEKARQEARQQGRQEGAARTLTALLRSQFGDHAQIPAIADRLSRLPDPAVAVEALTRAANLSELESVTG